MNIKILVVVLLLAGVAGAVVQLTSSPPPMDVLLARPDPKPTSEPGVKVIEAGPDPAASAVPSHITVLAYTSDSCPGCRKLAKHVASLVSRRPDVAVRLVDLGHRWGNQDYTSLYGTEIRSVPHVLIFDADGDLLAGDDGKDKAGLKLLYEWMNAEIKRDRQ